VKFHGEEGFLDDTHFNCKPDEVAPPVMEDVIIARTEFLMGSVKEMSLMRCQSLVKVPG
jgi:hypothetical protein